MSHVIWKQSQKYPFQSSVLFCYFCPNPDTLFWEGVCEEDEVWVWRAELRRRVQSRVRRNVCGRILNFVCDGRVLCGISEHGNYSLTSINRFFSRGGKYWIVLLLRLRGLCGACFYRYVRERADKAFCD